ncbi:LysM repeat protein [Caldicoprobacter guelmensis]|uniref:LysM peptidoglycan-binding domain-containing protein n=1 Tax=Caldicoprobacter guelmensis TaxID=1170224 RepID=UPI00195C2436|nr:LysM peptidoglycan-binding domain-containing protein [Caldicoprobacter guelmensis]MBM7581883.1 LysM repeat protein [Caldicoprobacter guelmensis]
MTYIVQPGDTLYKIARKFNTTVEAILAANNIPNPNRIYPGQLIEIPEEPAPPTKGFYYIVQPGDTLYKIAQRYNIPLAELIRANQIPPPYIIYPGQRIFIPGVEPPKPPPGGKVYIVQPGDTLYSIAEKFNVPLDALIRLNNIPRPDLIYPGQRLLIPAPTSNIQEEPK